MSMLSTALRKTGLNQPGKFLANNPVLKAVPGFGAVTSIAQLGAQLGGKKPPKPTAIGNIARAGGATGIAGQLGGALIDYYGPKVAQMVQGGCPKGFHPAKDGSGRCVRNRRMNPANGRAIRRAARRLRAAEKVFRRVLQVEGKHAGKIKPKKGK